MSFVTLRTRVADALTAASDGHDWTVHALPVDSVTPPAYLVEWADPWVPQRVTSCHYQAAVQVRCIAGRIEPDPGIETLELMVETALRHLDHAGLPVREVAPPRPWAVGSVVYLAALMAPIFATVEVGQLTPAAT